MGRKRVLNERKKDEVVALVTAGMQLHKVANYVGCDVKTIRRERDACPAFDQRVRRAMVASDLRPLEAMRRASATHWRAAAWMLEREDRQRNRTQAQPAFSARELAKLAERVAHVVNDEVGSPLTAKRIVQQIDDLFYVASVAAGGSPKTSKPKASGPSVAESMAFLQKRWTERRATRDTDAAGLDPQSNASTDYLLDSIHRSPTRKLAKSPQPGDRVASGAQERTIERANGREQDQNSSKNTGETRT